MGYDDAIEKERTDYLAKAQPQWDKLGSKGQAKYGSIEVYSKGGWNKKYQAVVKGLDASVDTTRGEFKWNAEFLNLKGDLPGTAGAGGYREYYAEPNPAHVSPTEGTWGKNRVLHKVNNDGGYNDSWWITDDHYINFKLVVG